MAEAGEGELAGGFITSSVTRHGGAVRRSAGPWSVAVHSWLAHLARAGVTLAPSPLSLDLAAGTEEVTYLQGTVLSGGASPPYLWRDETLGQVARLVRQFHDAAAGFQPPDGAVWQQVAAFPGGGEVICTMTLRPGTPSSAASVPWRSSTGISPHPPPLVGRHLRPLALRASIAATRLPPRTDRDGRDVAGPRP